MKELKFTTSKGEFILLDGKDTITERLTELLKEYDHYAVVKEMTEEQFAEVVDNTTWRYTSGGSDTVYRNYLCNNEMSGSCVLESAKQSFDSIVKSLGWNLFENPKGNEHPDWRQYASTKQYQQHSMDWIQDESKTLYNPILLKKI